LESLLLKGISEGEWDHQETEDKLTENADIFFLTFSSQNYIFVQTSKDFSLCHPDLKLDEVTYFKSY
jgi:hypothetical protein